LICQENALFKRLINEDYVRASSSSQLHQVA
jgi:hypothetical protein